MKNCKFRYKGVEYTEKEFNDKVTDEYFKGRKYDTRPVGSPITKIGSLSDLDEAFSGKILVDGNSIGLSIDEKVDAAYDLMEQQDVEISLDNESTAKRKKVIGIGGFVIDYTNVPKHKWKDLIREKIMDKQDLSGEIIKRGLVQFFAAGKLTSYDNTLFNSLFDEAERTFTTDDVDRLIKVFNYSNDKQYMLLSEAIDKGIIKDVTSGLLGNYNPLVGISTVVDKTGTYYEVDMFDVTRKSLFSTAEDSQQGNILSNIVGENIPKKHGVNLSNSYFSRQTILMNLAANIIARNNKNVSIKDSVVVQITPYGEKASGRIVSGTIDHVIAKEQQRNMMKFEKMHDILPYELKTHFLKDNEINNEGNYLKFLLNFYDNEGGVGENFSNQREFFVKDIKKYMDFGADAFNKSRLIKKLNARLSYLHRMAVKNGESYLTTPEAMAEHRYLLDALSSLQNLDTFSYQLNNYKDISKMQSYISIASAIPQEEFQAIQKMISDTSMKVVSKMQEFNKEFNSKVFDIYLKNHNNMGALRNENYFMYNKSMATITDINGVERNAGYLLWTTNEKEDSLFAAQAREKLNSGIITQEILDANRWIVEQIDNRFIDSIMHNYEMSHGSYYSKEQRRELTREDFKRKLFTETSYKRGMLPIIPKKKGEYFYKGDMGGAIKRQLNTISREDDFSELLDTKINDSDTLLIDDMSDGFFDQIAFGSISINNMSALGSNNFLNRIGLKTVTINGKVKFATIDTDGVANNSFSNDLQTSIKSFKLVGIRKQLYESEALPMLNATYFKAKIANEYKGIDNKNLLELMQDYVLSAVKNETKHLKGNEKTEKLILSFNKLATSRIMLFNLSIGQVSAISNLSNAIVESIANDISGHYRFGTKEIVQASVEFFADFGKVSELAQRFQVVNSSEMEQLTHFFAGYKGNKQILSEFMKSLPNWATDFYARIVVMTAQMMKDGTYNAYVFDKETGSIRYDEKLDTERWSNEEGLARRDAVKQQQIVDGIGYNEELNTLKDAYTLQEMKNLKWISDKYIIGGYDPISSDVAGITVMGKMFKTFRTFMFAKAGIIYKKSSYQNMGGRLVMVQDETGRYVGKWERAQIEGFVNTWMRFVGGTLNLAVKNPITLKNMTLDEKQNLARGGVAVSMFTLIMMLAGALIDDDDDNPYDMIDKKTGNKRYLPGIRFYKNFKFSASSLLLVTDAWGFLTSPFIGANIINNFMFNFTKELDGKQLRKGAEVWSGVDVAYELIEVMMKGSKQLADEEAAKLRQQRAETREANREIREKVKELKSESNY